MKLCKWLWMSVAVVVLIVNLLLIAVVGFIAYRLWELF